MNLYRMSVNASVCFDVTAANDEEAVAKAKARIVEWSEGLDVVADPDDDCRVYTQDDDTPQIETVDEYGANFQTP